MTYVIDIERSRGDTKRIPFTFVNSGEAIDISGWTDFKLTVDTSSEPTDDTANIGQLTGSLLTDGTDGKVYFVPTGTWDIGEYFYDAQALDSNSEKTTFVKGAYNIIQDITKD